MPRCDIIFLCYSLFAGTEEVLGGKFPSTLSVDKTFLLEVSGPRRIMRNAGVFHVLSMTSPSKYAVPATWVSLWDTPGPLFTPTILLAVVALLQVWTGHRTNQPCPLTPLHGQHSVALAPHS